MSEKKFNKSGKGYKKTNNQKERRYGEGQDYKRDDLNDIKRFPNKADLRGKSKGRNDASWYRTDSQVMKDAASLSFATTYGMSFDLREASSGLTNVDASGTMPGIMTFKVLPTFGVLQDWSSPFNVAVRDMYSFIRHANSGHSNYDAANLGMYLMAYDSAATFYAWMVRLYGLSRTVLVQNAYTPRDLITAAGGNYADLVANLADFRGYINSFAVRLNAMRIPSKWHILQRHMWMFTHVFADSPTNKASFYVFAPAAVWQYKLGATPDQTGLFPTVMADIQFTLSQIKTAGEAILDSILNDEDFNIMSGDILKAYGDSTFSLNLISEDYAVLPVYDPEVLMQIHNANSILYQDVRAIEGYLNGASKPVIKENLTETSNAGALMMAFKVPADSTDSSNLNRSIVHTCLKHILDVPTPNPDPTTVCVATRLKFNTTMDSRNVAEITDYGTEVILGAYIMESPNQSTVGITSNMANAWDLEKFDWHPYVLQGDVDLVSGAIAGVTLNGFLGDIDNYAIVSHATLSNIHRAAMLGMFEMV